MAFKISTLLNNLHYYMEKVKLVWPLHQLNVLPNNFLEKEVQTMFYPLNCLFILLFSPKYAVHNNYINPNGMKRLMLSFLNVLFIIVYPCHVRYHDSLFYPSIFIVIIINFIYMCNVFGLIMLYVLNIVHSQDNMLLIMRFQRIQKSLKFQLEYQKLYYLELDLSDNHVQCQRLNLCGILCYI